MYKRQVIHYHLKLVKLFYINLEINLLLVHGMVLNQQVGLPLVDVQQESMMIGSLLSLRKIWT